MNLSGKPISKICTGKFKDLPSSDWGCKYAEAALANGYISANSYFRPNDSVTNIEGLKMVMQARGIPKATVYLWCFEDCTITKWEDTYIEGSKQYNLIDIGWLFSLEDNTSFKESDKALRSDVFTIASRTFDSYKNNTSYWRLFENNNFTISYPEYWVYLNIKDGYSGEFTNDFSFWRISSFQGGFEFWVSKTDMSFEETVSQIGTQFSDRKVTYQDVVTKAGLKWKMAIITTAEVPNWISKTVFFETKTGNYSIWNGATESEYFEDFYKSFQIK